ncbi:MAG: aminopeptidase [Patescibacteria group bacterium]|nr:aminopeptidase [Patescibacteria group bacterium]
MHPKKLRQFAEVVCNAVSAKRGDIVLIEAYDRANDIVEIIVHELHRRKAYPIYQEANGHIGSLIKSKITPKQLKIMWAARELTLKRIDKRIQIISDDDPTAAKIVGAKQMKIFSRHYGQKYYKISSDKPWVLLIWPKDAHSNMAGMTLDEFREFNVNSVLINYGLLAQNATALEELMTKTDKVQILGYRTDLRFSIKDIGAKVCAGDCNLPDGEVFSAPVRESVCGLVHYNVPIIEGGVLVEDVELEFENGKVVKAQAKTPGQTSALNNLLNMDEGARYTGEFALGINPMIKKPVGEILFDEKICGSFHIALGSSIPEADNGNESGIHWDMICIQTPDFGGGKIYFDDVLIRKDGKFVLDKLKFLDEADYSL